MALKSSYLLTAPSDAVDALGVTMTSVDLIKGLRQCNANLTVPDPSVFPWYPLQMNGHTSMWIGEPFKGRKITVLRLGAIPEWTQLDPTGLIIELGWRRILTKAIRAKAVTKRQIERVFKISMDVDGASGYCQQCRREGLGFVKSNSKSGMCDTHAHAYGQVSSARRQKKDAPLALRDLASHESRLPVSVNVGGSK